MKRKKFIRTSLLALGGVTALPVLSKNVSFDKASKVSLSQNRHIRHGYYGKEFLSNKIDRAVVKEIRIDRFESPEGDMLLLDVNYQNETIRMAIYPESIIIQKDDVLKEYDQKESKMQWLFQDDIGLNPSKEISESAVLLEIDEDQKMVYLHKNPSEISHGNTVIFFVQ